jgi:hypothetical protein
MKLKIGNPCNENWDKMTPNDKGRFCQKCEKSVFDLSDSTDQEIIDFFKNKDEKVCGRLTKFQLNHDFYETPVLPKVNMNRYIAASFTLLALTPAVVAQTNQSNIKTPLRTNKNIQSFKTQGEIQHIHDVKLKLTDQNGIIITNAYISINGHEEEFRTDSLGVVKFDLPEKFKSKPITLYVRSNGFRYGEIILDTKNYPIIQSFKVEMIEEMIMGDIAPDYDPIPLEKVPSKNCKTNKK